MRTFYRFKLYEMKTGKLKRSICIVVIAVLLIVGQFLISLFVSESVYYSIIAGFLNTILNSVVLFHLQDNLNVFLKINNIKKHVFFIIILNFIIIIWAFFNFLFHPSDPEKMKHLSSFLFVLLWLLLILAAIVISLIHILKLGKLLIKSDSNIVEVRYLGLLLRFYLWFAIGVIALQFFISLKHLTTPLYIIYQLAVYWLIIRIYLKLLKD